ncbi:hypothetical protein EDD72_12615 [Tepidibacillus fermentans]|uniref:Uncharacterized protein n=1 Tax=Tepidibacillus fermentans TaxID=1281767 RepID=A0A4R3K6T3_9BACI|nr:hypothetical protein EDD72_12615 [Tepidibacillus fermentans]
MTFYLEGIRRIGLGREGTRGKIKKVMLEIIKSCHIYNKVVLNSSIHNS